MKEAAKQIVEITTSVKSGLIGIVVTWISTFWMDWGSVLVSALTAIGGLIYIFIIIKVKCQEHRINKHQIQEIIDKEKRDSHGKL